MLLQLFRNSIHKVNGGNWSRDPAGTVRDSMLTRITASPVTRPTEIIF